MDDHDRRALLAANDAFYRAFAERDFDAMDALWARTVEVACGHPGWRLMLGRDLIMESWRRILSNPSQGTIEAREPRIIDLGTSALVLCYERAGEQMLAATNLFVRERNGWHLAHHHASHVLEQAPPPRPVGPLH